jgi:hypothetical protein
MFDELNGIPPSEHIVGEGNATHPCELNTSSYDGISRSRLKTLASISDLVFY